MSRHVSNSIVFAQVTLEIFLFQIKYNRASSECQDVVASIQTVPGFLGLGLHSWCVLVVEVETISELILFRACHCSLSVHLCHVPPPNILPLRPLVLYQEQDSLRSEQRPHQT